ncbi:collagen alpha-1(I) chain-like [Melospiza melodia melodia]|uniref:collagen alpha-1(I) chain-like n=1 Tax=Melospiza melodia melodia TaxID=1914991 RepID=UPI002FD40A9E
MINVPSGPFVSRAEDARARAWLRPYEHTEKRKGKKRDRRSPRSEGPPRGGGARAPDRLPPRGETPTSHAVLRRRPRRPGSARPPRGGPRGARRARGGHGGPPALAFTGRRAHTHTRLGPHAAGGAAVGPRTRRLPFGPLHRGARGAPPRRRAAGSLSSTAASPRSRRHATTAVPPARLPARRDGSRRAGQRPGGRAPPPAPEADATETRAGVASARGLPDGRPRRRRGRTPGAAAAASHRRGPLPRHAPGGRRTALSRGATPALLVFTRRPGGGSAPAAARTPSYGPHAAGKGDGGRDVQGPGRDRRRRRRAPSGRPSPLGGTPVERRRRRSARGRPRSRASADGGPAGRSPPGRAGDRAGRGTAGGRRRRCVRGGKAAEGRGAGRAGRGAARARHRGKRAEERARRAPAAATPRPRKGRERALSAGVARYDEASGSAPAADRAPRPLRRGRAAERGGQGAPPRRGAVTPARACGGDDDDDDHDGGSAAGGRGHHRRGSAGVAAPHPSVAPHRRPATTAAAAAAAAGTAAATAGRAEPPESLNRRPARRPPFGTPAAAFGDAEGGNLGGEPPRRGALGTWPWGEGNDLHGPAGVPPPLPPSGERPPAGARPPSAATTAASFSGPGVSLSSPALRPRGPPRLGPPRRRGDAARPPSAPRPRARARPEARPGTPGGLGPRPREGHRSARERELRRRGKAPLPGAGRAGGAASSEPRRRPRHPLPRHFHIGRRRVPRPDGRPSLDGRSSEGRDGRASGRGRAEHPSLPAPGRLSRALRGEPASGELGPPPAGRPHATPGDRRSAAPAAVGGRLGAGRGPAPRRGRTGGRPARGGGEEEEEEEEEEESRRDGGPARRASRPGRDARCSAGSAPPARTVTGARGAPGRAERPPPPSARSSLSPEIPPRPEGSARLRHSLSGAAARGLDGKGVWPPRCRPRPAGRGAERSNGAGVRATPRARPAGRPGNAAGAEPHR